MTEHALRRERVARDLREQKADAVLISGLPNVRYLTGFTGSNALILLAAKEAVLLTDPRYTIQAQQESDCPVRIVTRGSLYEAAAKWIARKKWKRIGVERSRLTYGAYIELQEKIGLGVTLRPTSGLVEKHRMIKSEGEVAAIRA